MFAKDFRSDTLPNFTLGVSIDQQSKIRVAVHVDESGSYNAILSFDDSASRCLIQAANGRNSSICNGYICSNPWRARAVDNSTGANQYVVLNLLSEDTA